MGVQNSRKSGTTWAGSGAKPGEREVYVGVFGKHPGWDDHIDDIGLETDRLVAVKRLLYSEGIGGNIDAGAWEKLDEAQRLSAFGHEIVWRLGEDLIVGRLWASRDGKGRTRYPMAVVAQCVNVPGAMVEAEFMPRLEEAERRFVAASSPAEVRQIVDEVRAQLRSALGAAPSADDYGDVAPPKELAVMADLPQLGDGRVGLYRVLYEIDRELGAFRPAGKSDSRKTTKFVDTRAQHLRVPACSSSAFAAARQWFGVLATQIDPTASMLALRPHGKGFVDLIVGEPAAQQLFCVKASEKGLAPASEVPYTLDAEFVKRCAAQVEAWRQGHRGAGWEGDEEAPAPDPAHEPQTPGAIVPPAPKKSGWLKWAGIGGVLLLAAGAAYFATRGGQGPTSPGNGVPVALNTPPIIDTAAGPKTLVKTDPPAAKVTAPPPVDVKTKGAGPLGAGPEKADAERAAEQRRIADGDAQKKKAADETEKKRLAGEAERTRLEEAKRASAEEEKKRLAAEETRKREALVGAATELSTLLGLGYGLEESAGAGTLRSRGAALTSDTLFKAASEGSAEVAGLPARLDALERTAASTDTAALLKQAGGPGLAEALAAWARLSASAGAWPGSAGELTAAGKTLDGLRAAVAAVPDQARAAELAGRVNLQGKAVWAAYFKRVSPGEEQGIVAACALMDTFGVVRAELPARARFNVLLCELRRDGAVTGPIKPGDAPALAKARDRVALFAKDVSGLGLGDEGAAVMGTLETLTKALAGPAGFDPSKSGPGLRGWKGQARDAGPVASVLYSWPPEGTPKHTIEFLRVEAVTGPAFVATTEATLGLVIDVTGEFNRWPELLAMFPEYRPGLDARLGVRVWDWQPGGKSIGLNTPVDGFFLEGWLAQISQMKGVKYYPPEGAPPPPSLKSPIQSVSAPAALLLARFLACRLPTVAEWKAAAALPVKGGDIPNRRDQTWGRTKEFLVNEVKARGSWPDEGIFAPKGVRAPRANSAEPAVETDDGVMWFADQPEGGGAAFQHLVGNVAEFVLDQPMPGDLRADPAPEETRRTVGARGEGVKVIGGSALSPREVDPHTAYPLDTPGAVFSDVGFRLAFPAAGAQAPAPDVAGAIGSIKYFPWG